MSYVKQKLSSEKLIKVAYSDRFVLDLPVGHRFPMLKYELVKGQLIHEGTLGETAIFDPGLCDIDVVLETHDKQYVDKLLNLSLTEKEIRNIGFPLSEQLIKRCLSSANSTLHSALNALKHGIGLNVAGGTHHAFYDKGEGFCMLNDIAISSNYLLNRKLVKQILVVDLDVHQGNGTACLFQKNQRVFTFSMHGADNYPLRKEVSDLDIALESGTGNDAYLYILSNTLASLLTKVKPDIIFYQAGVDVLATDKLGKLGLTREGCKKRDALVLENCYKHQIPVAVCMGGGYSNNILDIVEAHCNTFRLAVDIFD